MSKTILANVDGFTPVIDGLVQELGLMSAVIFGRVWRYCQMKDGVCNASLEKIGLSIGVDRITVLRHIKDLCVRGYLEDLTPDLRNRPHTYRDTGKAGLVLSLSGVAESYTSESGVAQRNTGVAESDSTVAQRNRGVAESHLKKVFKKEIKKEQESDSAGEIWERVIDHVEPDTPRASFRAYVQPSQAVRYDGNGLTVLAPSEEARAWLESRLTTTAQNLLVGILNHEVRVSFVIAEQVPA